MEYTDGELMLSTQTGDTRAFADLVDRYTDRVYAFIFRMSGDEHVAEDATQETFIKLWKNRKRFNISQTFRPWLFTIARNSTLDILRKRKDILFSQMNREPEGSNDFDFVENIVSEQDFSDIMHTFDHARAAHLLEEALREITPDQRAAVILHDTEGLTFEEAGKVLGKPLHTVKSHYRRALSALRKKLDQHLHQNGRV